MRKILIIALTDLRVFISDRMNLISLTILPVAMALVLGGVFNGDTGPSRLPVDVIDQDQTEASADFLDALRAANDQLVLCGLDASTAQACDFPADETMTIQAGQGRVRDDYSAALLIIPAGYGDALANLEPIELPYYALGNNLTGDAVLTSIQAVLQRTNGAIVAARVAGGLGDRIGDGLFADDAARADFTAQAYANALDLWANRPAIVTYTTAGDDTPTADQPEASGFSQSVPGMATMYVLLTVLGGISLLLQERKQWTLQRLVVMPVSRGQILAGKILSRFTTGIIQFAVLFIAGVFVGLDFGNDLVALAAIIIIYTLCVTALAFAIAPAIRTEGQAGGLITMLGLVLSALGGAWWPLANVPQFMQVIGHLSPIAWAMDSFNALLFYGDGLIDILPNLAVLAVLTAILFVFGISRFQYE